MGFIKRFRARHEERRKLYDNIVNNRNAIRALVAHEVQQPNYSGHSEEVRGLCREHDEYILKFAAFIGTVGKLDALFYSKEMWHQVHDIKNPNNDMRQFMHSSEEFPQAV